MSCKNIEMVEFECDGLCRMKKQIELQRMNAVAFTSEVPSGWVCLDLTDEAMKAIGRTSSDHRMHFCPRCFALMMLPMWNDHRRLVLLSTLTEDELDDYGLDDFHQKALVNERRRLSVVAKTPITDHAYLSAGDVPGADGDRAYKGCFTCGGPRSQHQP